MEPCEEIKEDFTCAVCLEIMCPPIRMCIVGHCFCDTCHQRVERCPICRQKKSERRNFLLETILMQYIFNCNYQENGCKAKGNVLAIKRHEKFCGYTHVACFFKVYHCNWNGPLNKFLEHSVRQHPRITFIGNVFVANIKKYLSQNNFSCFVMSAYETIFKLELMFYFETGTVKCDVKGWGVDQIEPKYKYQLKKIREDKDDLSVFFTINPEPNNITEEESTVEDMINQGIVENM